MVRISIPTLPASLASLPKSPLSHVPVKEAAAYLARFLDEGKGKTVILSGAGVSVDSGIRAYRGKEGHYANPNYKPILYHELVEKTARGELFRQRYWARSFLGYPPVRDAVPNPTHLYVAALQHLGLAPSLITQNVDNLHPKAYGLVASLLPSSAPTAAFDPPTSGFGPHRPILELHGTLALVHCLQHRHTQSRDAYQAELADQNPPWAEEAAESERTGRRPRTNPDGDVELHGVDYNSFVVPRCRVCAEERDHSRSPDGEEGIVKPNVVFFGETLSAETRDLSLRLAAEAEQLLVLGTSLATYSAFRLVKGALEEGKKVLMISTGPSRADPLEAKNFQKMDRAAGPVLKAYLEEVVKSGSGDVIQAVKEAMTKGKVVEPPEEEGPRAEG